MFCLSILLLGVKELGWNVFWSSLQQSYHQWINNKHSGADFIRSFISHRWWDMTEMIPGGDEDYKNLNHTHVVQRKLQVRVAWVILVKLNHESSQNHVTENIRKLVNYIVECISVSSVPISTHIVHVLRKCWNWWYEFLLSFDDPWFEHWQLYMLQSFICHHMSSHSPIVSFFIQHSFKLCWLHTHQILSTGYPAQHLSCTDRSLSKSWNPSKNKWHSQT